MHWPIEASRQGRNQRQRGSSSSMSSEQVRNLKTLLQDLNGSAQGLGPWKRVRRA